MESLIIQYILIALVLFFAGYYLIKIIRKNFSLKKFKKDDSGCDQDCGCS